MGSSQDIQDDTGISQDRVERVETGDADKTAGPDGRMDREVAKYAGTSSIGIDEATDKRLRKLIDKRILVVMIITYFMQALDKGTISFVSIMGLPKDTGLEGQQVWDLLDSIWRRTEGLMLTYSRNKQFNWLTTCGYIAILTAEYPTNLIIQRVPIAKYLAFNIVAWGIVLACHAACRNFASLLVLRTLLGLFETCCQPSFIVLRYLLSSKDLGIIF